MIHSIKNSGRGAALALFILGGALLALGAAACATDAGGPIPSGQISVITTVYPLEYLARRIGGERVSVTNLTPPGSEPHTWEPSPADLASIQRAQVFIYNGAGFEPWAERVASELPEEGPVVVEASQGLGLHALPDAALHQDDTVEHLEGGLDPHVWLDPLRYAQQGEKVKQALAQADPAGEATYAANLASLKEELELLDREMAQGLASCQRDTIVVSHAAFGYLTNRYGIHQLAISGLSPDVEPSPARLREIVEQVRAVGATHIFFETLVSPRVAETIAREVGAQTLVLNPLEGLTPEELQAGQDYFSIMRQNLANLRTALACR